MNRNYLLIPGNPPAVYFYELWRREIISACPESQVKISDYPTLPRMMETEKAMHEVLNKHLDQLLQFHQECRNPITIIGHSLGGYFALKLLEVAKDCIDQIVLVHPFLRAPDWRGQTILKTMATLYRQEKLPVFLIQSRKFFDPFSSELPHVTDEELRRTFHLAWHENAKIASDRSPISIPLELRHKVRMFFNTKDSWCTTHVAAQMQNQVSAQECQEPHGFITEQKHRQSLFQKILAGDKSY